MSEPPYQVIERGPYFNVLQRTISETNANTGDELQQVQSYTELGDGMNYLSNGVWVPAQDLVELTSSGASAVHGQMIGRFNSDIDATGAITLTTAKEEFKSHPIGIFYMDYASGKVASIGSVQSSAGRLYPPNTIVFSNVFSGLDADLMLVWATNGFEQNLVLKQAPPPPATFGLSADTTTLQLWTAMDSCPAPQEVRPVTLDSGLQDHILIFGSTWFPVGGAFRFGNTPMPSTGQAAPVRLLEPGKPGVIAVAKSLAAIAGQQVLIEEVKYSDLASALSGLPQASLSDGSRKAVELANRAVLLQKPRSIRKPSKQPMQTASSPYRPSGVVLDYTELSGNASTYTFTNGSTYHIASAFEVGPGVAYFQQNACVKFDTNAWLLAYGNVSCSTTGSPTVFTSSDDNGYGAIVTSSTANPGYAAAEAIWMYFQTFQTTLQNVRVRWAQAGIRYDAGAANAPQLNNSALEDSLKGIFLNIGADTLYLSQDTECNVVTPIYNFKGNSFTSGTITTNCGVVTVAMVNDPNRDLYDYDTNKNSQTECSFVVCDSTNIVAAFMNTHLSEYYLGGNPFSGIPSPRMVSWARSTNGGTNFTDNGPLLPISTVTHSGIVITNGAPDPTRGDAGDPVMAYNSRSNILYLLTNPSREPGYNGFRLWASTDKGAPFTLINTNVPANSSLSLFDKPMIKASTTNLYVAGSANISGTNIIWAAASTNGGTNWALYQTLEATLGGDVRGADIAVLPDGTAYVFWLRMWGQTNVIRYAYLSTNHIWSSAASISPQLTSTNINLGSAKLLRYNGANSGDYFDDNCNPRVAYANGNIYIVYADLSSLTSADRGDIFLLEATVSSVTHSLSLNSGPRKVNNDGTQTDQWDPSITANPAGSELFIGYYSRQNDPVTNSWIMAYGARTFITNGLSLATFDCFPVSPTNFLPVFAGTSATSNNVWTFDPVWPAKGACVDTNDVYQGPWSGGSSLCPAGLFGPFPTGTQGDYANFCADDYSWCAADSNFFYFAWCDRTRKYQSTRPDADVSFAKIKP